MTRKEGRRDTSEYRKKASKVREPTLWRMRLSKGYELGTARRGTSEGMERTQPSEGVTSLWFSQCKLWEPALSGDRISHSALSCLVIILVVSVSICDRLTNWLVSSLLIA